MEQEAAVEITRRLSSNTATEDVGKQFPIRIVRGQAGKVTKM